MERRPVKSGMTEQLMVRMTPDMLADLKQHADDQDRPVAWLIRKAVTAYLADPLRRVEP